MRMSAPDTIYYTADMVAELGDESRHWPRYECVYGELLVTPSPGSVHYWVAMRLLESLTGYGRRQAPHATPLHAPVDISWGRDDVLVQPDVFVIPRAMARLSWRANSWTLVRHLLLATEVVSPSSRTRDRFTKRQLYQREGVPLYWIIDPDARTAEVWTPDAHFPAIEHERLVWHPEGAAEPFVQPLAELFAEP